MGAYLIKGQLSLGLKRADAAVAAFKKAQALSPSMRSYAGLVAGYLLLSRHKEALSSAKEALRVMPNSAHAMSLLGDVHARQPEGGDRARRAFEQALRLDPAAASVVLSLCDVHVAQGRLQAAAALVRRHLEMHCAGGGDVATAVALHCRLGSVLASSKAPTDALGQYQHALSLAPESEEARRGMGRVERLMKGQDPDAAEDEEDEDDEDEEDGVGVGDGGDDESSDFLG